MIYAVGDIHGKAAMLRRMLDEIRAQPLQPDDTVVFLGDYIDRGEDTRDVIETLIAFAAEHPQTVFLRGNHEQLMMDARDDDPPTPTSRAGYLLFGDVTINWLQNGGSDALLSYGLEDSTVWWESVPPEHWEFMRATRYEHIVDGYHFVHAGLLPPDERWNNHGLDLDPRLWIREQFLQSTADFGGRIVVFGHTPQRTGRPLVQPNKIGIDTGAVFGGPMTAAIIDPDQAPVAANARFLQVEHS